MKLHQKVAMGIVMASSLVSCVGHQEENLSTKSPVIIKNIQTDVIINGLLINQLPDNAISCYLSSTTKTHGLSLWLNSLGDVAGNIPILTNNQCDKKSFIVTNGQTMQDIKNDIFTEYQKICQNNSQYKQCTSDFSVGLGKFQDAIFMVNNYLDRYDHKEILYIYKYNTKQLIPIQEISGNLYDYINNVYFDYILKNRDTTQNNILYDIENNEYKNIMPLTAKFTTPQPDFHITKHGYSLARFLDNYYIPFTINPAVIFNNNDGSYFIPYVNRSVHQTFVPMNTVHISQNNKYWVAVKADDKQYTNEFAVKDNDNYISYPIGISDQYTFLNISQITNNGVVLFYPDYNNKINVDNLYLFSIKTHTTYKVLDLFKSLGMESWYRNNIMFFQNPNQSYMSLSQHFQFDFNGQYFFGLNADGDNQTNYGIKIKFINGLDEYLKNNVQPVV
jgi:hypothetical protein